MSATIDTDARATLVRLIKDIKIAMLTTLDGLGHLQSRPMSTLSREFDGTLWFLTAKDSRPSADVVHSGWVNLSYSSPEHERYVSVVGRAKLVDDRDLIKQLWKAEFATWLPLGPTDPDLVLLKVTVESAEYWESPATWVGWALAFSKSMLTGQPASQHRQLEIGNGRENERSSHVH